MTSQDVTNIAGEFDIDCLCGTLSFNLPYYIPLPDSTKKQYIAPTETAVNTNKLKKFDTVKLYFGEFNKDPGEITGKNGSYTAGGQPLSLVFDGFVDAIKLSKTKSSINYSIEALGTLGMANYKNMEYEHTTGTAYDLIQTLLQISGMQQGQFNFYPVAKEIIPANKVRFIDVDAENRVLITDGGSDLKTVLEDLTNKYALIIHQSGDGYVNVMTPFFLLSAPSNSTLNVNAWRFDLNDGTLFEIDYGDLTNHYNSVVVLGKPPLYGVAVDPIAVQNNGGQINYLIFESRNLNSDEDCQQVARDKLLDISKNFVVTVKTKFHPEFMVGQPFIIIDNDRFDGTQTLLLKKYSFVIGKDDVSCTVQGYANSPQMIPEDIALSNTGVLDVDILNIREKELDVTQWGAL
jgi:hypothetical protein